MPSASTLLLRRLAPAKINLSLRLLGPRDDGFTEIDSAALPLALADEIEFRSGNGSIGLKVRGGGSDCPDDDKNLAWRAADLFFQASGLTPDIHLTLGKNIPSGAGLGGGSSDAACVLLGLNDLHNEPLDSDTLHELAARLGSDVPFFLLQSPARLRGRGEILSPLPFPPIWTVFLIKPPFGVPTEWAYRAWKELHASHSLAPPAAPQKIPRFLSGWHLGNDLEAPVFRKHLVLPVLKNWIAAQSGVLFVQMSGSGSTMFAIVRDDTSLSSFSRAAFAEFGPLWITSTRTISRPG